MSKTNLPAELDPTSSEVVVFEPPTAFEVIDRGPATPVAFEHFGDSFVGIFDDADTLQDEEGKEFTIALFTGPDGRPYCIFPGASLERPVRKLKHGQWVRITYTMDADVGKPSPMKVYTVEVGL
jgi:hypothetical protein